jgi:hypothetical protein
MKINKVTAALIGMGIISAASVAQAQSTTTIYLTGSTAARTYIYNMLTGTPDLGGAEWSVVEPTSGASGSSNQIVYEGTISGTTYYLSCDFTGSEAGIASVANQNLTQDIPLDPNDAGTGTDSSTYSLPGVGSAAAFYQYVGGSWQAPASLPSGTYPDLTMADTSQAVSRTPDSGSTKLYDYGTVGVVPFTFMKGYEKSPDSSYNDCSNITENAINQALSSGGFDTASYLTGNSADTDYMSVVGRNFGSGTHVNTFLNAAGLGVGATVGQYAWNSGYPTTTPGTLTFGGFNTGSGASTTWTTNTFAVDYASGGTLLSVGNDGFDSGGGVGENMNVDASNSGNLIIGYLGISDAQKALTNGNGGTYGGGDAVPLAYNGVYESDAAVESGAYPYWGTEHLLGQSSEESNGSYQSVVGGKLDTAIITYIDGEGNATGNIVNNGASQSLLVPWEKMNANRSGLDYGIPSQGTYTP